MEESNFLDEYKKAGWKLCSRILGIKEEETTTMNKQELIGILEGLEGDSFIEKYNEGYDQAVRDCLIAAKQLDEPKKVVVPKFVAEWIELCKGLECTLYCSATSKLRDTMHIEKAKEVSDWLDTFENHELFAHAWLDGYEVEKGPLYHVLLPDKGATNTGYTFLNLAGAIDFTTCKEKVDMLTEQEIKAVDERYWPFAVKVDGE